MKSYITDNNNKAILSEQMKIIELIDADYRLLSIIMRLDITLPFGDISVEQMCLQSRARQGKTRQKQKMRPGREILQIHT